MRIFLNFLPEPFPALYIYYSVVKQLLKQCFVCLYHIDWQIFWRVKKYIITIIIVNIVHKGKQVCMKGNFHFSIIPIISIKNLSWVRSNGRYWTMISLPLVNINISRENEKVLELAFKIMKLEIISIYLIKCYEIATSSRPAS